MLKDLIGGKDVMIQVCDDCEYTILIADLIESLARSDSFLLRIWVSGSEISYDFRSFEKDFKFLQEGLKISDEEMIDYIFYDTIVSIKVIK